MDTTDSFDTAVTTSSFSPSAVVQPVQGALVLHAVVPSREEDDPSGSTVTLKGASTSAVDEHDPTDSQIGSIPSLSSAGVLHDAQIEPYKPIETKYQRAQSEETEAGFGKEVAQPVVVGTHRFTLVGKDAAALINGKKVASCESRQLPSSVALG